MARTAEVKVLGLLRRRSNFLKFGSIVREGFFGTSETKKVFRMIGTYHAKYEESEKVPLSYLKIEAEDLSDRDSQRACLNVIEQLNFKPRKEEYVEDLIRKFGQRALMKQSILETFDQLQNGEDTLDLDKLRTRIEQAMEIVHPHTKPVSFFDDAVSQIEVLDTEPRVPTGLPELDIHMRGGLPYGRMGIIIAPPKRGKTTFLINVGAHAVRLGYQVLHVSLEINRQETVTRYAQCICNKDFDFLKDNTETVVKTLDKIRKRGGNLFIEDLSDHAPTVEEIGNIAQAYRRKFDLLIVDYPDLCIPKHARRDEERPGIKEVYTNLRRLGKKLRASVWGASQSNRASLDKKVVSNADVAEDIRKIAILDIGVFWCQTPEEKEDGLVRFYIGSTRFSSKNPLWLASCDLDRMRLSPIKRKDT